MSRCREAAAGREAKRGNRSGRWRAKLSHTAQIYCFKPRWDNLWAMFLLAKASSANETLSDMIDPPEDVLAPTVVERATSIYESFRDRQHVDVVQACQVLTQHIFGLAGTGETSGHQLAVSRLAYLKALERQRQAD